MLLLVGWRADLAGSAGSRKTKMMDTPHARVRYECRAFGGLRDRSVANERCLRKRLLVCYNELALSN